jgi:hypothetical protein
MSDKKNEFVDRIDDALGLLEGGSKAGRGSSAPPATSIALGASQGISKGSIDGQYGIDQKPSKKAKRKAKAERIAKEVEGNSC